MIRMVFENVSLEPVTSRERGLATLTPIRTLSRVEKHVAHQGTFVAKTQGTVFTEVVLFVSMNPHVCLNVGNFGPTNSALIVLDSSVLSSVVFEQFC